MTYLVLFCIMSALFGNPAAPNEWGIGGEKAQIAAGLCSSQNCDGRLPEQVQCLGKAVPGNVYHINFDTFISPVQITIPLVGTWTAKDGSTVVLGVATLMYSDACHTFYARLKNVSQHPLQGGVCIARRYPSLEVEGKLFCTPTAPRKVGGNGVPYWDPQTVGIPPGATLVSPLAGVDALPAKFRVQALLEDPYEGNRVFTRFASDDVLK